MASGRPLPDSGPSRHCVHPPQPIVHRRLHIPNTGREEEETEERKMQELVTKKRKADAQERMAKKAKDAKEKSEKKREEAAECARKEAQTSRAINNKMAKALRDSNKDTYRRKREEAEDRAELVKVAVTVDAGRGWEEKRKCRATDQQ